jgi:hypothetical protein
MLEEREMLVLGEFDHLRQLLSLESNAERVKARGWEDAAAHARMYLYKRPDSMGAGYVLGFATNWSTKSVLMHQLRRRCSEMPCLRSTRQTSSSLTSPSASANKVPVQLP